MTWRLAARGVQVAVDRGPAAPRIVAIAASRRPRPRSGIGSLELPQPLITVEQQFGQVIDVYVSPGWDATAAHRFFARAIGTTKLAPAEVVADRAATYPMVLRSCCQRPRTEPSSTLTTGSRRRTMRGLKQDRSARVVIAGRALVQNLRRGHYELAVEEPVTRRLRVPPRWRRG